MHKNLTEFIGTIVLVLTIGPTIIPATMGSGGWSHLWLYLVGPLAGAAGVYGMQEKAV